MLHQDGPRAAWLCGLGPSSISIVTMDDATSTIYAACS